MCTLTSRLSTSTLLNGFPKPVVGRFCSISSLPVSHCVHPILPSTTVEKPSLLSIFPKRKECRGGFVGGGDLFTSLPPLKKPTRLIKAPGGVAAVMERNQPDSFHHGSLAAFERNGHLKSIIDDRNPYQMPLNIGTENGGGLSRNPRLLVALPLTGRQFEEDSRPRNRRERISPENLIVQTLEDPIFLEFLDSVASAWHRTGFV